MLTVGIFGRSNEGCHLCLCATCSRYCSIVCYCMVVGDRNRKFIIGKEQQQYYVVESSRYLAIFEYPSISDLYLQICTIKVRKSKFCSSNLKVPLRCLKFPVQLRYEAVNKLPKTASKSMIILSCYGVKILKSQLCFVPMSAKSLKFQMRMYDNSAFYMGEIRLDKDTPYVGHKNIHSTVQYYKTTTVPDILQRTDLNIESCCYK